MKREITLLSAIAVLTTAAAFAQSSGGNFEITKSTFDNGGGTSSGGNFSITGTIGQADANRQTSTGTDFSVAGGFWANAAVVDAIFKDGFESIQRQE